MDDLDKLFEVSKKTRVPQISGMDYKDYLALAIFSDAFVDVSAKEAPLFHERVVQPGRDLVMSVEQLFDQENVDIWKYADRGEAFKFIDSINAEWGDSIQFSDLVKFDRDDAVSVALNALGHEVAIKPRTKEFLANQGVELPSVDLSADSSRYIGVYKALDKLSEKQTVSESKGDHGETLKHLDRARYDLFLAGRKMSPKARAGLDRILSSLESLIGGLS